MAAPLNEQRQGDTPVENYFSWQILRYARFLPPDDESKSTFSTQPRNEQKWKHVSPATNGGLMLTITKGHLLLTNGEVILENYFLADMRSTMRGFIRGDSLLFVIKIKNEARKFRVRFAKGHHLKAETTCEDCASNLSYFFPVKPFEPPKVFRPPTRKTSAQNVLDGEIPVKDVPKVLTGQCQSGLPLSYSSVPLSLEPGDLNKVLRLFLSESSFPSFVEAVEKELDAITKDEE